MKKKKAQSRVTQKNGPPKAGSAAEWRGTEPVRTQWTWGDPPIDHCEVRGDEIVAWTDDSHGGIGTGCTLEEFASGRMNTVSLPSNVRREVTALVGKLLTVQKGQRAARLLSAQKLFAQQERESKRPGAAYYTAGTRGEGVAAWRRDLEALKQTTYPPL